MSKIGYLRSNFDNCVFLSNTEFKNQIVLLLYVDDILIVGKNRANIVKLKSDLNSEFDMKDMGSASKILGIEVIRDRERGTLFLAQRDYVKKMLRKFGMIDAKLVSTPLASHFKLSSKQAPQTEEELLKMNTLPYANVVGSIMYTMVSTRPDLAYSLSILSRFMANPGKPHWDALKWVLRYLKDTWDYGICYKQGTKSAERVSGYTDSDYAGCLDT